jgi:hypothetical protein
MIKLIDSLSEKICLADAQSIEMVQPLWFRQTNVPSFSLLTTSNHHKTQKCRSQDKKSTPRHLRPQDTNACVRHHLHLYLQVLAQSIWYNYSDPGKQTCPHSLSAATPHHHKTQVALMKKDMPHHLYPQDASACIRRHDWIDRENVAASARSIECLEPREDAACKCRGLEPWLMQANKHNICSHMPSGAAQTNNISCTIYTCPY